jgi:hypothetical protein
MTKSMEITEVPLRTLVLLSDSEGAYGIGINPSAWVRSFICQEHRLIDDESYERVEEDELDPPRERPSA